MTYRRYFTETPIYLGPNNPRTYRSVDYELSSGNSPRNGKGKLLLQENPLTYQVDRTTFLNVSLGEVYGSSYAVPPQSCSLTRYDRYPPSYDSSIADTVASAKFNGKLRFGGASLGVTVASWKQSRDMIANRFGDAQRALDRSIARLNRDKKLVRKLRKEPEPLAGQILEGEFGWAPLVQDVRAALGSAFEFAVPDSQVRGRHRSYWNEAAPTYAEPGLISKKSWEGYNETLYKARVKISNQNLWLLNRMGLVNPFTVAWDLVPWSFVANMFGNFNQLINSFTDEVGLEITEKSVTRTVKMITYRYDALSRPYEYVTQPTKTEQRIYWKQKTRTLGSAPPISFMWRVPDINWELAVIASSLVVQRVSKINNLIRVI